MPRPAPREVVTFAVVAFGLSWTLWAIAAVTSDPQTVLALDRLATFGPAVAALTLSPSTPIGRGRRIALFAGTAALGSALVLPDLLTAETAITVALHLATVIVAGAVVAAIPGRRAPGSARPLAGGRAPLWAWAPALLGFPALAAAGWAITLAIDPGAEMPGTLQLLPAALVFAVTVFFGGPLGEEPGWRGWLLPALLPGRSPLLASLLVGLLWGVWHLPLHLRGIYDDTSGSGLSGILVRLAASCLLAVLLTVVSLQARGSLPLLVLAHASVNNSSGYWLPITTATTVLLLLTALALVVGLRLYRVEGPWSAEAAPRSVAPERPTRRRT